MQKIALTNRADFPVAKESRQAERPESLLNHLRIMVWRTKHVLTAAIATAKATAINGGVAKFALGAREKFVHIFGRCRG